ncbi:hypothetical protein JOF56_009174 [Kibdelosporangium banguiense]|uniref:Uncharacterized protein n=1 Tax=Kibdelosporangium banguiense TaxID=1365924 RepID=A0ABS4TWN0_9PSEU|nr:hypothetical protein [Kibdelosporangium banguiense]MBP2328789.1 hypothetical protein [Kibdelosporangium banguiense]
MTSFEKFQASTEARQTTHGDHVDKLTGYFMAEANRLREQEEPPEADVPQVAPELVGEPPPKANKRFRWLRWWKRT